MDYKITAPHKGYNRKLYGVQFADGIATTDNAAAASWFSGRAGFVVTAEEHREEKKSADKK